MLGSAVSSRTPTDFQPRSPWPAMKRQAEAGVHQGWLGLLDVAGLRLEALYGGFDGEPLDDDSREYVFVARR